MLVMERKNYHFRKKITILGNIIVNYARINCLLWIYNQIIFIIFL